MQKDMKMKLLRLKDKTITSSIFFQAVAHFCYVASCGNMYKVEPMSTSCKLCNHNL